MLCFCEEVTHILLPFEGLMTHMGDLESRSVSVTDSLIIRESRHNYKRKRIYFNYLIKNLLKLFNLFYLL